MTADQRIGLARAVLARSRADATEISVEATHQGLTRFSHEAVNQNVDVTDMTIRVRAIVDGRVGMAATNALDPAALDAVAARAHDIALLAPRERTPPVLANARAIQPPPAAFSAATAAATAALRSDIASAVFGHTAAGLWCSGYATTSQRGISIVTSSGGEVSFDGTDAGVNVKMNGADSTGFAEAYSPDVASLDGDRLGREAARIARETQTPRSVEPGDWTVILAPAAAGELLHHLAAHFCAEAFSDGSSFITGKLGSKVSGANVTLRADFSHPLNPGMPFDYEGFPTQALTLVERGVANAVVTDSTWAQRLRRPNTGHAPAPPNDHGPQANFTVLEPGPKSLETLIAETSRGLLITRLWYVRVVDVRSALLTGMTRDGTYLIENGALTCGVRNMRFNESIVSALDDCEIADLQVRTGGYSYSLVTPAIKFNRFRFASASPY